MEPGNNPIEVKDVSDKPKKLKFNTKSKKLKILAIVLVAVLVVGGVASALVVKSIYNKPENVLAKAISKYAFSDEPKNFDASMKLNLEEPTSGIKDMEMKMSVLSSGKSAQVDMELNLSVLRLRGAVQTNENGDIYVKVKDLPALLGSDFATAYGIPEEMKQQIQELDDTWIEITKADMDKLSGGQNSDNKYDKCVDKVYELMANESLADKVDGMYKDNRFFLAKSSSEEVINGKKLLKVEVGLDKTKLESFANGLKATGEYKDLATTCGINETETLKNEEDNISKSTVKNGKVFVWLDRGKKELVKMEMTGEFFEGERKTMTASMTMDVKDGSNVKLEAPEKKVNIMELLQKFGIDTSMFGSQNL
jgi:hypothetical protein